MSYNEAFQSHNLLAGKLHNYGFSLLSLLDPAFSSRVWGSKPLISYTQLYIYKWQVAQNKVRLFLPKMNGKLSILFILRGQTVKQE